MKVHEMSPACKALLQFPHLLQQENNTACCYSQLRQPLLEPEPLLLHHLLLAPAFHIETPDQDFLPWKRTSLSSWSFQQGSMTAQFLIWPGLPGPKQEGFAVLLGKLALYKGRQPLSGHSQPYNDK